MSGVPSLSFSYIQTLPTLPRLMAWPPGGGPNLQIWREKDVSAMLTEAWLHSGRRTG